MYLVAKTNTQGFYIVTGSLCFAFAPGNNVTRGRNHEKNEKLNNECLVDYLKFKSKNKTNLNSNYKIINYIGFPLQLHGTGKGK